MTIFRCPPDNSLLSELPTHAPAFGERLCHVLLKMRRPQTFYRSSNHLLVQIHSVLQEISCNCIQLISYLSNLLFSQMFWITLRSDEQSIAQPTIQKTGCSFGREKAHGMLSLFLAESSAVHTELICMLEIIVKICPALLEIVQYHLIHFSQNKGRMGGLCI